MEDQQEQVLPAIDTAPAAQPVTIGDTKVVFGLNGFNLKTPESARNFFNLFLTFATIANIVVAGFPQMPPQVKLYVLESSSVLVLIVKQVEGMFGVVDTPKQ